MVAHPATRRLELLGYLAFDHRGHPLDGFGRRIGQHDIVLDVRKVGIQHPCNLGLGLNSQRIEINPHVGQPLLRLRRRPAETPFDHIANQLHRHGRVIQQVVPDGPPMSELGQVQPGLDHLG